MYTVLQEVTENSGLSNTKMEMIADGSIKGTVFYKTELQKDKKLFNKW